MRIYYYDTKSVTADPNEPLPLLVQRHNVIPGMILVILTYFQVLKTSKFFKILFSFFFGLYVFLKDLSKFKAGFLRSYFQRLWQQLIGFHETIEPN